jgi:hypothetical protein
MAISPIYGFVEVTSFAYPLRANIGCGSNANLKLSFGRV